MWDRFRSASGGGDGSNADNNNNTASWQPRSSVIAARQQPRQSSVGSYHPSHGKTGPPPPRPPRIFSEQQVPPAPLSQRSLTTPLPPLTQQRPRQSHARGDSLGGRPASSVYSQPSPLHTDFRIPDRPVNVNVRYRQSPDEVSPPSSPELLAPGNEPNHDISPIDEEDGTPFPGRPRSDQRKMSAHYTLPSQQQAASRQSSNNHNNPPPGRSNLPMMRRERRQQQRDADAAANRGRSSGHDGSDPSSPSAGGRIPRAMPSRERLKTPVRQHGQQPTDKPRGQKDPQWDPMTGEIAKSGNGRPSQVKPVDYARGLGISTMSSKSPPASRSPEQLPRSNTDPAATAFMSNRPGWRGASGRTAIVDPVQDNMEVEPLKVPPKSARRAVSPLQAPQILPPAEKKQGNDGDIAMASPPISPETQTPKIGGVYSGSAWQGPQTVISSNNPPAKSSKMSTLSALNTIRKIIPSGRNHNNTSTTSQQGYPSPPLSGSPTPAPGPGGTSSAGSAPVNAQHLSTITTNTVDSSNRSIRRKEIGSSHPPSTHLNPIANNPRHQPHDSFSSSVYTSPDDQTDPYPQPPPNTIRLNSKDLPTLPATGGRGPDDYVQPPSRFSVTTYATSTGSPRDSVDVDAPPLPMPPKDIVMSLQPQLSPLLPQDNGESVLARARPKLRGGDNKWEESDSNEAPIKISLTKAWMSTAGANSAGIDAQNSPERTRKPRVATGPKGPRDMLAQSPAEENKSGGGFLSYFTSALSPIAAAAGDATPDSRPASSLSVDKALPLAPPQEVTASMTPGSGVGSRIDQLNAQLSGLGNRRININRAIEQMTKLMPQDNLLATDAVARKREAEKRKIEELERELADIQREEHELGMKLHRAYKKLDSQTEYEPTTLWVRRAAR